MAIGGDAAFTKIRPQEAARWGLRLEVGCDLSTVVHRLTQTTPEVILLALDSDGADNRLTLLQALKADYPAIPIVILSGQDSLDVIKMSLEGFGGWQVVQAESGSEGLLQAKAEPFDAILLDISMPEMDGFECFEQLQADLKTQMIPVVLLTAKALPSDRRRFAAMGVAGVIIKPFNSKQVWKQVAEILGWSV